MTDMSISGNNNLLRSDGFIDLGKITETTRSLMGIGVNSEDVTIHADRNDRSGFYGQRILNHSVVVEGGDGDDVLDLRFVKLPHRDNSGSFTYTTLTVYGHGGNDTFVVADPGDDNPDIYGGDGDDTFIQARPTRHPLGVSVYGGEGTDTVVVKDTFADADIHIDPYGVVSVNGMVLEEGIEFVRFNDKTLTIKQVMREAERRRG